MTRLEREKPGIPVKQWLENYAALQQTTQRGIHHLNVPPKLVPYYFKRLAASFREEDTGRISRPTSSKSSSSASPRPPSHPQRAPFKGERKTTTKVRLGIRSLKASEIEKAIRTSRGVESEWGSGEIIRGRPDSSSSATTLGPKSSSTKIPPQNYFVLLVGILYTGTVNELAGCVNDNEAMIKYFKWLGVPETNIVRLSDDTPIPPSRANITSALYKLMLESPPNSKIFFCYSGHGGEIVDSTGTESSGRTQVIFPLNFEKDGVITDDEFFRMYNSTLSSRPTVSLFCWVDACHSGTWTDAPYQYTPNPGLTGVVASYGSSKRESKANVTGLAAALDSQTAADDQSPGEKPHGAGTDAFIKALYQHTQKPLTKEQFLLTINKELRQGGFVQRAQLTSTRPQNLKEIWEM